MQALRYCESVAKQVSKKPDLFSASLIHILTEVRIVFHFGTLCCTSDYFDSDFNLVGLQNEMIIAVCCVLVV